MCLLHLINKKNNFSKVFPVSKKSCCICYEEKNNLLECINPKCNEGNICNECFEKMSDIQKEKCPVCRGKRIYFTKIVIVKEENNIEKKLHKKKQKKNKEQCFFEIIKIMLTSVICLSINYAIGLSLFLLVLNENINLLTRTLNPVLFIFIGFILIILIMFICVNCFRCIR